MPESQGMGYDRAEGLRSFLRHLVVDLTRATAMRERTKPHTSLYVRFHRWDSCEASLRIAAVLSLPAIPSTENTSGVKCFL